MDKNNRNYYYNHHNVWVDDINLPIDDFSLNRLKDIDIILDRIACDTVNKKNRHVYHDETHCFKNNSMICRYQHLNQTNEK